MNSNPAPVSFSGTARWLRAAGYDTEIATDSEQDYYLLQKARDSGRLLITRDRGLAELRRAEGIVILVESENIDDIADELAQKLDLNWQHKPFSRCLTCNTELTPLPENADGPADIDKDAAQYCPTCKQVFWDGSHVNRMRNQLNKWQQQL